MLKAFKTELQVNKAQEQLLRQHVGARRFVYNWMLAECIAARERGEKKPSQFDLVKSFRLYKKTLSWYEGVIASRTEEGAARDLHQAFQHFFRRCKQGKGKKGFPKFQRRKEYAGSFNTFGKTIRVTETSITIEKIGKLKLKEYGYIPTGVRITSVTISQRAGRWFVSALCDVEIEKYQPVNEVAGIDLGISHALVISDGTFIDSPKPLKNHLRKLRELNKSLARKTIGSNRRRKALLALSKEHYKIANIRKDFIHKATSYLVKTKQVICLEDLNVSGMIKNHCLAQAISDIGFYEIRRQLEYKALWRGREVVFVDRFYPSSKTCSNCGSIASKMPLSVREWQCPDCGSIHNRDLNAAKNLEIFAMNHMENQNARGVGSSSDNTLSGQPDDETRIQICLE